MKIGGHFPISKGLVKALEMTGRAGGNTMQFFTKNPGQWKSKKIDPMIAGRFIQAAKKKEIAPLIVHDSYLINLASADEELLRKSIKAFIEEIERAEMLSAKYIVTHMGAHKGAGEKSGLEILTRSVAESIEKTPGMDVTILLETTAGQGTQLGYSFSHIGHVIKNVRDSERLGVCLDTCHIFAAGYDITSDEGYKKTLDEFEREIGLKNLKVVHVNDAKKPLGSRVDRHEFIGKGHIGIGAFERIVNDPGFSNIPLILETPEPEKMHKKYIKLLRYLGGETPPPPL
ncbi:MAG: deoxyribonuclease IV [Candidatus Eremiobacteraeota bacterium]|nr:deoxyribonuclease IV [Candidatus Eremiobacteraeota bacterium]